MINFKERIILIKKVSKPNRGSTLLSYSVLVAFGDCNGGLGVGKGNGNDQNSSILKAFNNAKKNFFKIPLNNGTIYHEIMGKHGSTSITLIPSKNRCGLFAGGALRVILEVLGIKGIISKIHGSTNPYNVSKAAVNALINLKTPFYISNKRGIDLKKIIF